jgi:hypothetical protein
MQVFQHPLPKFISDISRTLYGAFPIVTAVFVVVIPPCLAAFGDVAFFALSMQPICILVAVEKICRIFGRPTNGANLHAAIVAVVASVNNKHLEV